MGKFVLKVYRVWYDWWTKEYKKPDLDFAWPIVDSIKLENVDFNDSFHLKFVLDWRTRKNTWAFLTTCHVKIRAYMTVPTANRLFLFMTRGIRFCPSWLSTNNLVRKNLSMKSGPG